MSGVIAALTVLADAPLEDGLAGSCRHGHYHLFALREKEIVQIEKEFLEENNMD